MDPFVERVEHRTLADKVYGLVKIKIIQADLPPGARLNETRLAETFGVSTTPVREAIGRLETEGLVESIPYKGRFVADLSQAGIEAIYEVRAILEEGAVALACSRRTDSHLDAMQEAVRAYEVAIGEGDVDSGLQVDMSFHEELVRSSGNEVLVGLYRQLADRIQALRRLDAGATRRRKAYDDHEAILRALSERDSASASSIIRRHIVGGREHVLDLLETTKTALHDGPQGRASVSLFSTR